MAMKKVLTDLAVLNAKPGATRREIPDGGQRGLYLIVQSNGSRSWAVRYRINNKARKLTLQSGITLAQARKLASDAMFQVAHGIDPIEAKKAEKERKNLADETTVQSICTSYMAIEGKKLRSRDAREILPSQDCLPESLGIGRSARLSATRLPRCWTRSPSTTASVRPTWCSRSCARFSTGIKQERAGSAARSFRAWRALTQGSAQGIASLPTTSFGSSGRLAATRVSTSTGRAFGSSY